jgi:hypothetical protein
MKRLPFDALQKTEKTKNRNDEIFHGYTLTLVMNQNIYLTPRRKDAKAQRFFK